MHADDFSVNCKIVLHWRSLSRQQLSFVNKFWVSCEPCTLTISASTVKFCCVVLTISELAATLFSSMIFELAVNHVRWRFQRQLWNCVALMISKSATTQFSSMISELAVNHICWRIQHQLWNYVALMISESVATWFSSMISEIAVAHMGWRFLPSTLLAANQFSLLNCVVSSESVFAAKLCCLQRISFCCGIMVSIVNQFSLSNCGVSSELAFDVALGYL